MGRFTDILKIRPGDGLMEIVGLFGKLTREKRDILVTVLREAVRALGTMLDDIFRKKF